ncbi:MAG: hypothetical protein CW342_09520 [Thermoactinomycetaceae bacterium]|nr:hypothetical protein [Bacillota bacterium]MBO2533110.1 hypothetical protein [Thermoactinomycetaceae bacterium]
MWESFPGRWDPIWAGVLFACALLYEGAIRWLRAPSPLSNAPWKRGRPAFYSGLLLSYAALGSPLAPMAHHSFSVQMLRLSLLCWFAPILVLPGLPPGLLGPLAGGRWRRAVFSFLTHPAIALISFHLTFFIVFYPPVFDALASRPLPWAIAEGLLVLTAYLMWFPVFPPLRGWERLNEWKKMIYLTISALLLTPVSFWLLFADVSLYHVYETATNPFALDPVTEQKIAGAWMKLVQVFLFGGTLTYWFFRWVRKEQRKEPLSRKTAEKEAVARLLLNQRVALGKEVSSSENRSPKKRRKSSPKVISLPDRRQKKNPRIDP